MSFKFKKSNLNLRVYSSATEPTKPGLENDIVIITSVPMSNWTLSPDAPSDIPRADGDAWIQYSVAGNTFNALKNDTMIISVISTMQYVNGEWIDVPAKRYHGGEWVELWDGYLYNLGDECSVITGGWIVSAIGRDNGTGATYNIEKNTTNITIPGVSQKGCIVHPANKIDLSGKTKIVFTGTLKPSSNAGYYSFVGIWSEFGDRSRENLVAILDVTKETTGVQELAFSGLNGMYYIGVAVHGGVSSAVLESLKVE